MTLTDLATYTAVWADVVTLNDFSPTKHTVYSSNLTSSGPFLQFMLRTLDGKPKPSLPTLGEGGGGGHLNSDYSDWVCCP